MGKTQKSIVYVITAGAIIASIVYMIREPSPNECFVDEMRKWGEQQGLITDIQGLLGEDENMAVAKAKTVLQNYKPSNLSDVDRKIYDAITTRFTYCGVK